MELPTGEVVLSVHEVMSTSQTIDELIGMLRVESDPVRQFVLKGGVEYRLNHLRYMGAQSIARDLQEKYEMTGRSRQWQ